MQTAKQAIYAQVAKAKLIYVKNKDTYKLVCAFNVYETKKQFNNTVYKFPVQAKCDYVSGDISKATLAQDLTVALNNAKKTLRTNNIVIVD
jgi:hypothetical protein